MSNMDYCCESSPKEINSLNFSNKNSFFYGYTFPVIVSFFLFFFWMLNLQMLGLSVIVLFASYLFVSQKDFTPLLPLLFMAPMCFRTMDVFADPVSFVLFGIIAVALIINLIRFPLKVKRMTLTSWAYVGLIISLFLGGVSTGHLKHYLTGLPHIAFLGFAMFAEYIVISNRVAPPSFINLKKYFAFTFITATNLACSQLVFAKFSISLYGYTQFVFKGPNFIGWANTIHIGYLILFSLPLCCYLMIKTQKNFLPLALEILFLYFCGFMTKSDGTLGLMIILTPILIITVHKKIPNQNYRKFSLFVFAFLLIFSISELLFVILADWSEFIDKLLDVFSNDNHRSGIYRTAIRMFKQHPLFGAGFGCGFVAVCKYSGYYHSTFFHIMANLGIIGLIAYGFLYFTRIKTLTAKRSLFNFITTLSFMTFALYAMVDNGEFHFLVLYVTALVAIVEITNKKGNEHTLPLFTNRKNNINK